jgi:tetratricopeptide (TPR) repeat protein
MVEKNDDSDPWKRWSLRRTAVYQKFSHDDQSSTWILLTPSERASQRVQESLHTQSERTSAQKTLETHLTLFSSAAENWRSYYNSLEAYFNKKVGYFSAPPQNSMTDMLVQTSSALHYDFSTPDKVGSSAPQAFDVKFDDLQKIQRFEEKVHEFQRSLDANKEAILALARLNNDIRGFIPKSEKGDQCWYRVDHALEKHRLEIDLWQRNIDSFLKRISGRSQLVLSSFVIRFSNKRADTQLLKLYNILDLKNSTLVSFYEQTQAEINAIARKDTLRAQEITDDMHRLNKEMRDMAEQTSKDAVSMKIITLVAMIYLPITFIAVSTYTIDICTLEPANVGRPTDLP